MREGRIAAKLHHPNAIAVFDVVDEHGAPCLIMEYLPSKSLAMVMAERGPLPAREVARIGAQSRRRAGRRARGRASCTATSSRATSCSATTAP